MELSKEEKLKIEQERKLKEKSKECQEEIQKVLEKYGMVLQLQGSPQIIIIPKR